MSVKHAVLSTWNNIKWKKIWIKWAQTATLCYLDDIIDVYLAVLVFIKGFSEAQQLVFWNVLDVLHDSNQLVDAHEILPVGQEYAAYRKRLLHNTESKMVVKEELTHQPITCRDSRAGFPGNALVIDSTLNSQSQQAGYYLNFRLNQTMFIIL